MEWFMFDFLPEEKDWVDFVQAASTSLIAIAGLYLSWKKYREDKKSDLDGDVHVAVDSANKILQQVAKSEIGVEDAKSSIDSIVTKLSRIGEAYPVCYAILKTKTNIEEFFNSIDGEEDNYERLWYAQKDYLRKASDLTGNPYYRTVGLPAPQSLLDFMNNLGSS